MCKLKTTGPWIPIDNYGSSNDNTDVEKRRKESTLTALGLTIEPKQSGEDSNQFNSEEVIPISTNNVQYPSCNRRITASSVKNS